MDSFVIEIYNTMTYAYDILRQTCIVNNVYLLDVGELIQHSEQLVFSIICQDNRANRVWIAKKCFTKFILRVKICSFKLRYLNAVCHSRMTSADLVLNIFYKCCSDGMIKSFNVARISRTCNYVINRDMMFIKFIIVSAEANRLKRPNMALKER